MRDVHINNSDEVVELANKLSSEGDIEELKELLRNLNDKEVFYRITAETKKLAADQIAELAHARKID